MLPKILFSLIIVLYSYTASGVLNLDSLTNILKQDVPDSTYYKTVFALSKEYHNKREFAQAIKILKEALDLAVKTNNKNKIAAIYSEIGNNYHNLEQSSEALEYLFKSLLLVEELKDTSLLIINYNTIGIIYSNQKKHDLALKYFQKYANTAKSMKNNKIHLMRSYNNIGITYKNKGDLKSAEIYYRKALKYAKETDYKVGEMSCYYNIGVIYNERKDYQKSIEYTLKGLAMAKQMNNNFAMAIAYINLSETYYKNNDFNIALLYSDSAMIIARNYNFKLQLSHTYEGIYKIYKATANYQKALEYLEQYLIIKDSLFNEESNERVALAEKNYQAVKIEREMESLKQEKKLNQLRVKGLFVISCLALLAFGIFLWRFIEKKKSNAILLKQRDEIASQKKEITDSINYASRIQQAMLPQHKILQECFKEYFILHIPKDIVCGDFYWFIKINNDMLLAVADCTGHGVPGALMSMIGNDKLNHATLEKGITSPAEILADINKLIKKALKQDDQTETTRDGMDIALINYTYGGNKITFSGANRPLWLLRNNEIIEYKPTKKSIAGFTDYNQTFDLIEIEIHPNDIIYLFTDGFADQFGGDNQKKITTKKFKELLLSIGHLSLDEQKIKLEEYLHKWKNNLEQTDDICMIGLKF